jgi:NitT/TauT family transport system ATP-binding protein
VIFVEKVGKTYYSKKRGSGRTENTRALDGIDFKVGRGELACLLGPSGCGKTTLLRMVAGLIKIDEGRITVDGQPVDGPRKDRCMVFQHFGLLPWRTVLENVVMPLEVDGFDKQERTQIAKHYIDLVGLTGFERHYPHEISGGMQQRVGIARALVRKPLVLLMDEPFGALDAQTREQLQDEFLRIWGVTRNTVLFVSHSIDEALVLANRILVFTPGPGRIKEVIESPFAALQQAGHESRADPAFGEYGHRVRALLRA